MVKNLPDNVGDMRRRFDPWIRKICWRRKWQPTPVFLPGEAQGRGSLVGCRLWVAQSRTRLKQLSSSREGKKSEKEKKVCFLLPLKREKNV